MGPRMDGGRHGGPDHVLQSWTLTSSSTSGEAFEDDHSHVQALLDPDFVHDPDDLQGQHVLPQVVS